jgi:hypothetical protein
MSPDGGLYMANCRECRRECHRRELGRPDEEG